MLSIKQFTHESSMTACTHKNGVLFSSALVVVGLLQGDECTAQILCKMANGDNRRSKSNVDKLVTLPGHCARVSWNWEPLCPGHVAQTGLQIRTQLKHIRETTSALQRLVLITLPPPDKASPWELIGMKLR
jgi:hypothetical protein